MSIINKNNYEAYMLDYIEQNLSPEMVAELMLFLEAHPELKNELDMLIEPTEAPLTTFNFKEELKINAQENLLIASAEGITTEEEEKELSALLADNVSLQADYVLFKKTKLIAPTIVFEHKDDLKKKETKVIPLWLWASSAAAVLLFFFWLNPFSGNQTQEIKGFSSNETIQPKIENELPEDNQKIETMQPEEVLITSTETTQLKNEKSSPANKQKTSMVNPIIIEEQNETEPLIAEAVEAIEPSTQDSITLLPEIIDEPIVVAQSIELKKANSKNFFTIPQFLRKKAKQKALGQEDADSSKFKGVNALEFLAKIAGKNAELKKKTNSQGELEAYAFNVGRLSFNRKVKK